MIRAILADDEGIILKGLKKLIDWKRFGVEIVGEARDGREALALIREKDPQLVVSDIAMPGLSGLDMLREIGSQGIGTKVIFVSGYQEFSYAQDAVRYGAVDYLLKPVEQEELERAVVKALSQIDDQSRLDLLTDIASEDRMHQIFQKIGGSGEYAKEDLYEQFSRLAISVEGKAMVGAAFRLYTVKRGESNAHMQELLKFSAANKIQKKLEEQGWGFVVKKEVSACYVILLLEPGEGRRTVETRIRRLIKEAAGQKVITVKAGVGERVEDVGTLPLAYKTARFAMELYYFTEEEIVWYTDVQKDFNVSFEQYQEEVRRLKQSFLDRARSIDQQVERVSALIRDLHFGSRFAALNRCDLMLSGLIQDLCGMYLLDEGWLRKGERCMEQMRLMPTYRQTCEVMTAFLGELHRQVLMGGSGAYNEAVRIRQYVAEHFTEDLTLEYMAQMVGMNPYYFSSYFKKNTGMNFKAYLTDIRMEEAARLLLNTDHKAYEIAQRVGYRNVRQFNENFRGRYGKSPNAFRKEQKKGTAGTETS